MLHLNILNKIQYSAPFFELYGLYGTFKGAISNYTVQASVQGGVWFENFLGMAQLQRVIHVHLL